MKNELNRKIRKLCDSAGSAAAAAKYDELSKQMNADYNTVFFVYDFISLLFIADLPVLTVFRKESDTGFLTSYPECLHIRH